jgi:hypothetical protein
VLGVVLILYGALFVEAQKCVIFHREIFRARHREGVAGPESLFHKQAK